MDAQVFTEWAVGGSLCKLGYTKKVSTTIVYQAFTLLPSSTYKIQ